MSSCAVMSNWGKWYCGMSKIKLKCRHVIVDICHTADTFSQNSLGKLLRNEDCTDYQCVYYFNRIKKSF